MIALRDFTNNNINFITRRDRFRLARLTGVYITPFCRDPPWVRTLGYWWSYVHC